MRRRRWRHANATAFLRAWWRSALDAYDYERDADEGHGPIGGGPANVQFRESWPWEQERLHAVLALFYALGENFAHVVPHPNRMMMEWHPADRKYERPIKPWCFAHLPQAKCFIEHFCEHARQKMDLVRLAETWEYAQRTRGRCVGRIPVISRPLPAPWARRRER